MLLINKLYHYIASIYELAAMPSSTILTIAFVRKPSTVADFPPNILAAINSYNGNPTTENAFNFIFGNSATLSLRAAT